MQYLWQISYAANAIHLVAFQYLVVLFYGPKPLADSPYLPAGGFNYFHYPFHCARLSLIIFTFTLRRGSILSH